MIYCCAISDLPRRISALQWVSWLLAAVGVFLVLFAHGHYTIDIIIAYYITTRLFWTYHTLANNSFLIKVNRACNCITLSICEFSMSPISIKLIKLPFILYSMSHIGIAQHAGANNYLAREWWYKWSRYFEQNVRGQVPNEFEWPLSWPRRFQPKFPNRES